MLHTRLAVVLALLLTAQVASADTAPERALILHDEAKTLYAKGKYNDAVDKLKLAVELDPEAKVLYYNLGLIEEKLGHIDTALAYFRRCLELEQSHDERLRLAKTIKRLEGALTFVDWKNNTQAAPVIIRRDSSGGSTRPDGGSNLLPWAYVAGATSVAAAIVGIGLASHAAELDPGDAPMTTAAVSTEQLQADADEAHALAIGADVSFGIAAGALATTVALALVSAHGVGTTEVAAHHTLSVGPTGGRWTWRF